MQCCWISNQFRKCVTFVFFFHSLHGPAPELCQKLVKVLVVDILPTVSSVWDAASTVRILEACLSVCDDDRLKQLHGSYFKGHLKSLAETNETKFSVVKLLEAVQDKELVSRVIKTGKYNLRNSPNFPPAVRRNL